MGSCLSARQSGFSAADMCGDKTAGWSWNCSFIVQFGGDGTWILVVVGGGPGFGGKRGGGLCARPSGFSGLHGW